MKTEIKIKKERWSKMTTLTNTNTTLCDKGHTPHNEAISVVYGFGVDVEYTFCEVCENNIERDYFYDDYDRLPFFTKWTITQ